MTAGLAPSVHAGDGLFLSGDAIWLRAGHGLLHHGVLGFGGPLLLSVFFLSLLSTIPMIDWIPTCSVQSGHHVGSGGVGWRRVLVHRIVASGPRGCGSACQQASGVDGQCRGLGLYGRAGLVDMKQRAYSLTNLLYRSSDVYHL